MYKYECPGLEVDFYPNFIPSEAAETWFQYLEQTLVHAGRRTSTIFGDEGKQYVVNFTNGTRISNCIPWSSLPSLSELKTLIEQTTGQKYTVCVMQRYPTGKVGINPHRDKEMIPGTMIVGLSFGATRTLTFSRNGYDSVSIKLPAGSLYVMQHPTNQYWSHCVETDSSVTTTRISLTFRNY
jgi:alpha-ketoglutarate-dependent dioxygenase alkB family protein 2